MEEKNFVLNSINDIIHLYTNFNINNDGYKI